MPDPARFQQLGALFDEACDLDAPARAAFVAALATRDPDLAGELASLLAHDQPEGGVLGGSDPGSPIAAIALGAALASVDADPDIPVDPQRFRIIRKLGEGGMARVYEAEQLVPRRRVAIKVLRKEVAGERMRARFRAETEILGRLIHPGIAAVHEAVVAADAPYIVMELVLGDTLIAHADAHALSITARVELLASIAEAVAFAHAQGVVHRDLKPANILVDPDGRPKVLDFGIARVLAEDTSPSEALTRTGELVGTPAYMSPEQTTLEPGKVGVRADVYALGVIGYQLLTGQMPYPVDRNDLFATLAHIRETIPTSAGRLRKDLRGDLEVILDKALEKSPERRYTSAGTFAEDLRRWLTHQPIRARAPSSWYQLARFARRNRALVALFAVLGLVLVVGVVVSTTLFISAERARADLAQQLDALLVDHAKETLAVDPANAVRGLTALSEQAAWDRAWLIGWSAAGRGLASHILRGHIDSVEWFDGSPDGGFVASASYDGTARIWNLADSSSVTLIGHHAAINRIAFAPAGPHADLVASGGRDGVLRLWRRDGSVFAAWPLPSTTTRDPIEDLAFSPDGADVATGSPHGAFVWSLPEGHPRALTFLDAATGLPRDFDIDDLGWSPDGRYLAAATHDALVLWDLATTAPGRALTARPSELQVVAFSPDGALVAGGDDTGAIYVYELATGRERATLKDHHASVKALLFVDQDRIAAGDRAGDLRLHDLAAGTSRVVFQGGGVIRSIALSPDRRLLATASDDRMVRLHDLATFDARTLRGHRSAVQHVAFVGDHRVVSSGAEGEVRVWEVPAERTRWDGFEQWPRAVVAAPDGSALAMVDAGGWVRRLHPHPGAALPNTSNAIIAVDDDFFDVAWSAGTSLLATGNRKGRISLFRDDGALDASFDIGARPTRFAFAPDGNALAIATANGTIALWDVHARALTTLAGHTDRITDLRFVATSARTNALVSGDRAGHVRIGELGTHPTSAALVSLTGPVSAIATSPDGGTCGVAARSGEVVVWTAAGTLVQRLALHLDSPAQALALSATRLAVGTHDGAVHLVDLTAAARPERFAQHEGAVTALLFSSDGRYLASGSDDRTVRVRELASDASDPAHFIDLFDGPIVGLTRVGDDRFAVVSDETSLSLWPFAIPSRPEVVRAYLGTLTTLLE